MSSLRDQREKADLELGLTAVYEEALDAKTALQDAAHALSALRSERRDLEVAVAQREADITQETWAANSDMPVTRLDKLVKVEIQSDPMLQQLRTKINALSFEIDRNEARKTVAEADIRIKSARMNELQGILNFTVALMQNRK